MPVIYEKILGLAGGAATGSRPLLLVERASQPNSPFLDNQIALISFLHKA